MSSRDNSQSPLSTAANVPVVECTEVAGTAWQQLCSSTEGLNCPCATMAAKAVARGFILDCDRVRLRSIPTTAIPIRYSPSFGQR